MPEVSSGANVPLGRGKVYFDRFTAAGVPQGERYLGDADIFELTPTSEQLTKYSSASPSSPLLASDVLHSAVEVRISGGEFTKENVALALFGTLGVLSQTGSTATDEVHTAVIQGCYYKLLYREVSAVTVTGPSGTPSYDLNDDYTVDAVTGRIYIVEGGAITTGLNIEVDYTYATIALDVVQGITEANIKGMIRFKGENARGPNYEVEVWIVSIKGDGPLAYLSDEYATFSLLGMAELDEVNHPNEPVYRQILVT